MKPVHERNQECLPPKKRDIPQSTEDSPKAVTFSGNNPQLNDASEWPRGMLVAAGQNQMGLRYSDGGEAVTSVTVDQYGNFYRVAVPAGNMSSSPLHPVVNMSQLPHPFSVGTPVMQHPGISYSPIQYAPLSHTSVQFIGSYAVPYAVPPGFLPSSLVSPPVTLAPTGIPHYVPYNSILSDGATPPPQTSHAFSKLSSAGQQQQHQSSTLPVAVAQGRVPIYYHTNSRIPGTYTLQEAPSSSPGAPPENVKDRSPVSINSTNGGEQEQICNQGKRTSHAMGANNQESDGSALGDAVDNVLNVQVFQGYQTRGEVAFTAHRGTPDTDLEVQRVVSGLASQDYHTLVTHKESSSPLNLSQHVTDQQNERRGSSSHTTLRKPSESGVERIQMKHLYTSPLEQASHSQLQSAMVIANGETVLVPLGGGQGLVSSPSELTKSIMGTKTPETQTRGNPLAKNHSGPAVVSTPVQPVIVQPPAPSPLPSHFMKGAIIQLATGELKRVEDLQTQDFIRSAEVSGGLKIDSSTVVDIQESQWPGFVTLHFMVGEQQSKVTLDVPPEHPFFVYGQGWSSCNPGQTAHLFALPCHRLQVGDVCISISLQNMTESLASPSECPQPAHMSPKERTAQRVREQAPPLERDGERKGCTHRDSMAHCSHTETSSPSSCSQRCWSGQSPGFQRYDVQSEGSLPSPARPSFIPQEVKLSIEGRSNAGK